MKIEGYVTDKNKSPIANALVEVKGDNFVTLFSTESKEDGHYVLDIPAGRYSFLTAVKEYGINYLEYWCQNISLHANMTLDVSFDKLEIYGLHVFPVKGAGNSLMVYFRPMSLKRFQQGEKDIAPEGITIKVWIDEHVCSVIGINPVKEFAGGMELSAYLIQIDTQTVKNDWDKLEIQIRDKENNYGSAAIFNEILGDNA